MSKQLLSDDTVISIGKSIPLGEIRAFFEAHTGKDLKRDRIYETWLAGQIGNTLRDALAEFCVFTEKTTEERLDEKRFDFISASDKAFIAAFDKEVKNLGYDYGGVIGEGACWGKNMMIFSKTGVKSKPVAARIFIREDCIILRLFFNDVDKHRAYIENAPAHIKEVFTNNYGNCSCNPKKENCRMRKTYNIDGKQFEKCSGVVFEFWKPCLEKLPDYIYLLTEFYPVKKSEK